MNAFIGHAKSLGELYVFYSRLNEPGSPHPTLGKYVKSDANRILKQTQKYSATSSYLRKMSYTELKKEEALLEKVFGINLNVDSYTKGADYKEVINAINECMSLKDIYERNKQLIQNYKGKKAVYSWYPTYFLKAWEEKWPLIKQQYERAWQSKRVNDGVQLLSDILDKKMPEICLLGIEKMLDGPEVEGNLIDPELKNAYKQLVNQIGDIQTEGSFANQIYRIYQLDNLKQSLLQEINNTDKAIYAKQLKPKVKDMISSQIHSRGGLSQEAIENAIFSEVGSKYGASVYHSGSKGIKADNIMTIAIDPALVHQYLEKAGKNREENIEALSDLGEKISQIDDSFIIYSSDKNWTLNKDFTGYDVGSTGSKAQNFIKKVYRNDEYAGRTLLGAINQLGDGAMLEGREKDFELLLAQEVAYMLFDDFTTIGDLNSNGKAIHVMNLNGILVPLSAILSLLADAIDTLDEGNIRSIANVKIKVPGIIFETDNEQFRWMEEQNATAIEAWNFQRKNTLDNSYISAKILKNFKHLVTALL